MTINIALTEILGETCQVSFVKSVFKNAHLPELELPEIAFAGRSNVGKSSLINKLVNRRNLVKVSSKPGKTQSLNYFRVKDDLFLVDLPGYGFAKVPKKIKNDWQGLITSFLENRETLCCVVVIIDLRHAPKSQDRELIGWLQQTAIPYLLVYTKSDKLSRNQQLKQAKILDAGFNVSPAERVIFSAKTGAGLVDLITSLEPYLARK